MLDAYVDGAARAAGLPVMMMVADPDLARDYHQMGATAFLIGSDQSFLRAGAAAAARYDPFLRRRSA